MALKDCDLSCVQSEKILGLVVEGLGVQQGAAYLPGKSQHTGTTCWPKESSAPRSIGRTQSGM